MVAKLPCCSYSSFLTAPLMLWSRLKLQSRTWNDARKKVVGCDPVVPQPALYSFKRWGQNFYFDTFVIIISFLLSPVHFTFRAPQSSTVSASSTTVIRKFGVWRSSLKRKPFSKILHPGKKREKKKAKLKLYLCIINLLVFIPYLVIKALEVTYNILKIQQKQAKQDVRGPH